MKTESATREFLNSCRARGLSSRTIAWYETLLYRFGNDYPKLPTNTRDIESFLGAIGGSDETRHGYYRTLRVFYGWASKRLGVDNPVVNITAPVRRKKRPRTLSLAELGWLLAAPLSSRDRALVTLLVDTGIRIGEAVHLTIDDIGEETILVDGKTGQREVPISEETRRQLSELGATGYLFTGPRGPLSESGALQAIHRAMTSAGISGKKLGPHTLRHTFGRQYIVAGGDLVSLQRIMGHAQISTTRIYVDLDLRDVLSQHHRFSPLRAATRIAQGRLFK